MIIDNHIILFIKTSMGPRPPDVSLIRICARTQTKIKTQHDLVVNTAGFIPISTVVCSKSEYKLYDVTFRAVTSSLGALLNIKCIL